MAPFCALIVAINAADGRPPDLLLICAASRRPSARAIWETTTVVATRGSFGVFCHLTVKTVTAKDAIERGRNRLRPDPSAKEHNEAAHLPTTVTACATLALPGLSAA